MTSPVVVSVINMKGGVGKSTIAHLLGVHGYNRGLNVLEVDLDPQANLSQSFMREGYRQFLKDRSPSIVEVFQGYLPPSQSARAPRPLNPRDAIRRIYSNQRDGNSLQLVPSRFDFSDNLTSAIRPDPKVLARFLAGTSSDRDMVIIDCAPTESVLTMAAYAASRYILVPVKPEYFATIGFELLQTSIDNYTRNNLGQDIEVLGIVINNWTYDGGNNSGPEKRLAMPDIRAEARKNKWRIFENEIPHSRGFPKIMRGIFTHQGNAAKFWRFADEFFASLGF